MKYLSLTFTLLLCITLSGFTQSKAPETKPMIMLMGTTHFGQEGFYKQGPGMDLFSEARQKEVTAINAKLA